MSNHNCAYCGFQALLQARFLFLLMIVIVGEMNVSKSGEIGVTSILSLWHMRSRVYQARDFQNQKFRNDRWSNGGKKAAAHPGIQHTNGSRDGINAAYVLF